jgi:TolB protein
VIRRDGTGRTALTHSPDAEYCPSWSPDGNSIALAKLNASGHEGSVEVITTAGTQRWQIEAEHASCPAWSPNGKWLAYFDSNDFSGGNKVVLKVVTATGSGRRQLAANVDPRLFQGSPAWSPDSNQIAYMRAGDPGRAPSNADSGKFLIRFASLSGAPRPPLRAKRAPAFCAQGCELYAGWMTWAPAHDIAFLIVGGDLYPQVLYAIRPDGTHQRLLSGELQDNYFPAWSPDGKRIAVSTRKVTDDQIWIANADGTGLRQLTRIRSVGGNISGIASPTWSPDGKQLAGLGSNNGIYPIDVASGRSRLVVRRGGYAFGSPVSWQQ